MKIGGRPPRRSWIVVALVLLLGACTARYVTLTPQSHHQFAIGFGQVRDMPLISPTLLGWILPGDRTAVESAQFSPDGRWLYLGSGRGVGDQLAVASVSRPKNSVIEVDLRLITYPLPGRSAIGIFFGTRISLDPPVDAQHPPTVIDAATGALVRVDSFIQ